MVFKSSTQKMDLVTTDYYAKELKYQDKIDEVNRTNALSEEVKYTIGNNAITIILPKDFEGKQVNGKIDLYCPSDETKDISQAFNGTNKQLSIPFVKTTKGLYELQITWQVDKVNYYYQKKIFI
jgi:nitrogen fixation protein FixH